MKHIRRELFVYVFSPLFPFRLELVSFCSGSAHYLLLLSIFLFPYCSLSTTRLCVPASLKCCRLLSGCAGRFSHFVCRCTTNVKPMVSYDCQHNSLCFHDSSVVSHKHIRQIISLLQLAKNYV